MSHVVTLDIQVSDFEMADQGALRCGLIGIKFRKALDWGAWLNDYHGEDAAYKNGYDPEDYGNCEFCLVSEKSPVGQAEAEARKQGRHLSEAEIEAILVERYGPVWQKATSKDYSISFKKNPNGGGFKPIMDTMDQRLMTLIGGKGAPKLRAACAVAGVRIAARKERHQLLSEQALPDGSVKLRVRVPRRG